MIKNSLAITLLSLLAASANVFAEEVNTRFGKLKITEENEVLYKGQALDVEVNSSLSVLGVYKVGEKDILLMQNNGGTGCPALFSFVIVSKAGAKSSPEFGSCTDLVKVSQSSESVTVAMHGFRGPFESKSEQRKALKEKFVYLYKNGVLFENGKAVK